MIKNKVTMAVATGSMLLGTISGVFLATEFTTKNDCQARLNDPAPLSQANREFLERCVSAFTLPTPTPGPTTPVPTTAPATTRPPTTTPPSGFPTPATTGVPNGWVPTQVRTSNLRVTAANSVIQDLRITGSITIAAVNVTIRRVEVINGSIDLTNAACQNGNTLIEDTSIIGAPGHPDGAIRPGGYTARRVEVNGPQEGYRDGGRSIGCGPVTIEDSFARAVAPSPCPDWHGDALQGYDGPPLIVRNVTLELVERSNCGGTAPFFVPRNQGNTSVDVNRLLVIGGGYTFRLGMPGRVVALRIATGWAYGPIDVRCSVVPTWEAQIVNVNNYSPSFVRNQTCNTESGF